MHPTPRRRSALPLALFLAMALVRPALAIPLDHDITDGSVFATAIDGDNLFIGGSFSYVGPPTGGLGRVDQVTGALDAALPTIDGLVSAIVPDGAGGWYVGGSFQMVQGMPRQNLARILADNSVAAFSSDANSSVEALVLSGDTLYVGGFFTSLGGQARSRLAAVNATSGAVLGWNPGANGNVRALVLYGSSLYVGGEFTQLTGTTRNRLGAVHRTTGALQAWNPNAGGLVWTLVRSGTTIYTGGNFPDVNGLARPNVAAIDAITGAVSAWTPNPSAPVRAVAVSGSTVYIGGGFQMMGGVTRKSLAAVDAASGALLPWAPAITPDFTSVLAMVVDGATLRIGGTFRGVAGQSRDRLAQIDRTTGAVTSWAPSANGPVDVMEPAGSQVMIGGNLSSLGGATRSNLAALSRTTGRVTAWTPGTADTVRSLAVGGGNVYAGGVFLAAGGQPRNRLAAFSATTGLLQPWNPGADGAVWSLIASGDRVFVGGRYTSIAGQPRPGLSAVHGTSGAVRPWNPALSPFFDPVIVRSMLLSSDTLVVVGNFTGTAGTSFLLNIATLDTSLAGPLDWGPKTTGLTPLVLGRSGNAAYVGGNISSLDGEPRSFLAGFSLASGAVLPFAPMIDAPVHAVTGTGVRLYAGGEFGMVDGNPRSRFAAFDQASGTLDAWNPSASVTVEVLAADAPNVVLGGRFAFVDGRPAQGIAVLLDPVPSAVPGIPDAGGEALRLLSVGPNPAATGVTVRFHRGAPGRVSLALIDAAGRRVADLVAERDVPAGESRWRVPLPALPGGTYFWRLAAPDGAVSGKITILP
jgi:hypothetical protein